LSNVQVELLINLWHNEPSLWDSSSAAYSDGDVRKAAVSRISAALELDVGKLIFVYFQCIVDTCDIQCVILVGHAQLTGHAALHFASK